MDRQTTTYGGDHGSARVVAPVEGVTARPPLQVCVGRTDVNENRSRIGQVRWHSVQRWHRFVLSVVLLFFYAYFFPRWADWNQNSRFDLVLALVEDRSVAIDRYVANTGDYAFYNGHYYSDKAPGLAFLGAPVYAAFRLLVPAAAIAHLETAGRNEALQATLREDGTGLQSYKVYYFAALAATTLVTVAVPSAILGVLFYEMLRRFGCSARQGLMATAAYTLGTNAFPYANSFVGHQLSAFLLFVAFALLFAIRRGTLGRYWLIAAGLLLGHAAVTEYPAVLIGALLALYAVLTIGRLSDTAALLAAGAAPPLLALGVYNLAAFGTPLPVGYLHSTLWIEVHQTGFISLTYPRGDALWGLTFGVHRGLFFLSPFLLFALPGYLALWRDTDRRPEFWVLLLAPLSFLLFNASSAMWQGGFAVGPRYLLPSLPFLALAAGVGIDRTWHHVLVRIIAVVAIAWSFSVVWAETIAGQAFPDYTPNPLFDLSLPTLASGDVARNVGMLFGLSGWASLAPLVLAGLIAVVLVRVASRSEAALGRRGRVASRGRAGVIYGDH